MSNCNICPFSCNVDRTINTGVCRSSETIHIVRASPHFGEEPCISGVNGSGTVFFSGCSLGCVFCQNHEISRGEKGKPFSVEKFAEFLISVSESGVHNINLVTPSHYSVPISQALSFARKYIRVPVVWNSSGYENSETLKMLEGLVDIFLTDSKYYSSEVSSKYSNADNYFEINIRAISEMIRQRPENIFDESGIMRKGVIIRHLVLPSHISDSRKLLSALKNKFSNDIFLSLMCQYIPEGRAAEFPEINRRLRRKEFDIVVKHSENLGFKNGYIQQFSSADKAYIPDFCSFGEWD